MELIPSNNCDISNHTIDFSPNFPYQLTIFPNPSENRINIHIEGDKSVTKLRISIFDSVGRQLEEKQLTQNSINIAQLPSGLYYMLISIDDKYSHTAKFIKK